MMASLVVSTFLVWSLSWSHLSSVYFCGLFLLDTPAFRPVYNGWLHYGCVGLTFELDTPAFRPVYNCWLHYGCVGLTFELDTPAFRPVHNCWLHYGFVGLTFELDRQVLIVNYSCNVSPFSALCYVHTSSWASFCCKHNRQLLEYLHCCYGSLLGQQIDNETSTTWVSLSLSSPMVLLSLV